MGTPAMIDGGDEISSLAVAWAYGDSQRQVKSHAVMKNHGTGEVVL